MRAGCSLTVWPRQRCTFDFLLLSPQLTMFFLPVLHVNQQRNKAVFNLQGKKTSFKSTWGSDFWHFTKSSQWSRWQKNKMWLLERKEESNLLLKIQLIPQCQGLDQLLAVAANGRLHLLQSLGELWHGHLPQPCNHRSTCSSGDVRKFRRSNDVNTFYVY